jgi:hypothetical protein
MESESSAVADAADLHVAGILRRENLVGIGARRRCPEGRRELIADSLVRPFFVVAPTEGIELPLLPAQAVRWWTSRLALEHAMIRSWVAFSCGLAGWILW